MRTLLAVAVAFASLSAHAGTIGSGPHGGMSTGAASPGMMGMQSSQSKTQGAAQGGNGGYYYGPRDGSVVDNYQPWPEREMRQFQRP